MITISNIESDFCDLDTEYREALAHFLVKKKYLSNTPLSLQLGTEKQQEEYERVWNMPLNSKQIKEIMNYIAKEMNGDYQYSSFNTIKNYYISIANDMDKGEER